MDDTRCELSYGHFRFSDTLSESLPGHRSTRTESLPLSTALSPSGGGSATGSTVDVSGTRSERVEEEEWIHQWTNLRLQTATESCPNESRRGGTADSDRCHSPSGNMQYLLVGEEEEWIDG